MHKTSVIFLFSLNSKATKRLLKDIEILEKESIPTVGVAARPLEHNLFLWHANIRGPEKT